MMACVSTEFKLSKLENFFSVPFKCKEMKNAYLFIRS